MVCLGFVRLVPSVVEKVVGSHPAYYLFLCPMTLYSPDYRFGSVRWMELIWEGERWGGGQVKVDTIYGQMDESYTYKQDWARAFRYRQCLLRLERKNSRRHINQKPKKIRQRRKKTGKKLRRDRSRQDTKMKRRRRTERRRRMWPTEGQSLSISMKNCLSFCPLCPHVSAHTHRGEQADLWGSTDWIFSGINRDLAQCNDIWTSWLAIWWHCRLTSAAQEHLVTHCIHWGCIQTRGWKIATVGLLEAAIRASS